MTHLGNINMLPCPLAFTCLWPTESPGSLGEERGQSASSLGTVHARSPELSASLHQLALLLSRWSCSEVHFTLGCSLLFLMLDGNYSSIDSVNGNFIKTFFKLSYFKFASVSLWVHKDWWKTTFCFLSSDFGHLFLHTQKSSISSPSSPALISKRRPKESLVACKSLTIHPLTSPIP